MPPGSEHLKRAAYDAALSSSAPVLRKDLPIWETTLWPNRSLSHKGFRNTLLIAATGFALPVVPFMAAGAGWILAPFIVAAFGLLWMAIIVNNRHGRLREHICLWQDQIAVERHEVGGQIMRWQANPYWVRLKLMDEGGPVANYLTLIGSDREIELGAFLSPEERLHLKCELERRIQRLDINA